MVFQYFALLCKFYCNYTQTDFYMITKKKLIESRNSRGISQEYMADRLCMDVSNYNRRESGKTKISADQWKKIAQELDVPLEDIYEADENLIFIFNDNATGNGNIVTNNSFPQNVLDLFQKHISVMEQEIHYLKELIQKVGKT